MECALAAVTNQEMRFLCSRVRGKERAVGSIQGFLEPEKDAAAPYYVGLAAHIDSNRCDRWCTAMNKKKIKARERGEPPHP
jgi:hypothetical protein